MMIKTKLLLLVFGIILVTIPSSQAQMVIDNTGSIKYYAISNSTGYDIKICAGADRDKLKAYTRMNADYTGYDYYNSDNTLIYSAKRTVEDGYNFYTPNGNLAYYSVSNSNGGFNFFAANKTQILQSMVSDDGIHIIFLSTMTLYNIARCPPDKGHDKGSWQLFYLFGVGVLLI